MEEQMAIWKLSYSGAHVFFHKRLGGVKRRLNDAADATFSINRAPKL